MAKIKYLASVMLLLICATSNAQYYPWGAQSWKEAVINAAALPATGNTPGDTRVSEDTFNIYVWNGSMWVDQSGSGSVVPGGVNGSVQFKNGASFAGDSDLLYSGTGSGTLLLSGTSGAVLKLDDQSGTGSSDLQFQSANAAVWDMSSGASGYPFQLVDDGNSATPAMSFDTSDNVNFSASIMSGLGAGGGIIQANGSPGEFRINDTSGGGESIFEFSKGPIGSETDMYDWITGAFGPLTLYDAHTMNLMESWDSSDNLSFNSNSSVAESYTFNGGPDFLIMNDTSGSGSSQLYWSDSVLGDQFALYAGNGGYFTLQDLMTGAQMMAWDTADNATLNNLAASSSPALSIVDSGSSGFSLSTNTGISDSGELLLQGDINSFNDIAFRWGGAVQLDIFTGPSSPEGNGYFTLWDNSSGVSAIQLDNTDSTTFTSVGSGPTIMVDNAGGGNNTQLEIESTNSNSTNLLLSNGQSVGGTTGNIIWLDADNGNSQQQNISGFWNGSAYIMEFGNENNSTPALSLDTTNDTATISTLIGGGIFPPAVSTGGNGSMYFDLASSSWMISESGSPYQPITATTGENSSSIPSFTWDGTPPTVAFYHYRWNQSGKSVTLYFTLETSAAGVANTNVSFVLPPDMPLPHQWSGEGNSSYLGSGQLNATGAPIPGGAFGQSWIYFDGTNWDVTISNNSATPVNTTAVNAAVSYLTD